MTGPDQRLLGAGASNFFSAFSLASCETQIDTDSSELALGPRFGEMFAPSLSSNLSRYQNATRRAKTQSPPPSAELIVSAMRKLAATDS